jgi:hypothetical protein
MAEVTLDSTTEDTVMPALLTAGLAAWIAERGEAGWLFTQDAPPSAKPSLHARLRLNLDETTEDEAHWAFRAITSPNAVATLNRLRGASVAAGLNSDVPKRRLFVLRNAAWSGGPRTHEAVAAFEQAGGRTLAVDAGDLEILAALRSLLAENPPNLQAWLTSRRPTGDVKVLGEALGDAWTVPAAQGRGTQGHGTQGQGTQRDATQGDAMPLAPPPLSGPRGPANPEVSRRPYATTAKPDASRRLYATTARSDAGRKPYGTAGNPDMSRGPYVTMGQSIVGGRPVTVDLETLRKHTAIFAGSGSGKTVLIRRLVEECALQGVSAIVLDPNNDLARLGDQWPETPPHWGAGDAAKAAEYLATTDVVVWTPRRTGGRPLSFRPLPDFASVVDDADEFGEAVDAAVASIVPRAKLDAKTNKAQLGQAVLREALEYCGRRGSTSLEGFIEVLASLPDGVSKLDGGGRIAADLAQTLTAAMVNDPLFGGGGTPVDPGLLLTPPEGKRARVSVISLVGLQSDGQRQGFVNQLQMALFAWIKKHPAGDRPLGGLFVMDEAQTFAPSGMMSASTHSTLALASQARKYGLGLVFATQAPKGLHNRIPGNAATQFFGLLNSPIQIGAAREMAQAKGCDVADISRLTSGQFYAAGEGAAFEKIQAPMCLSHHPRSPLSTEEVIERARQTFPVCQH